MLRFTSFEGILRGSNREETVNESIWVISVPLSWHNDLLKEEGKTSYSMHSERVGRRAARVLEEVEEEVVVSYCISSAIAVEEVRKAVEEALKGAGVLVSTHSGVALQVLPLGSQEEVGGGSSEGGDGGHGGGAVPVVPVVAAVLGVVCVVLIGAVLCKCRVGRQRACSLENSFAGGVLGPHEEVAVEVQMAEGAVEMADHTLPLS